MTADFSEFTLGKYRVTALLGRGGFGTVYRAIDTTLDRDVAIKVLHAQLAIASEFLGRFRREAKTLAGLQHPNVVGIYEYGEDNGRVFIAMEHMPGGNLYDRLVAGGPLDWSEALGLVRQIAAGLDAAHAKGLVHRDMKPANVLFGADGRAVVSDFGLVHTLNLSSGLMSSELGGVGTPFYKAPELWLGSPAPSPATDVYALGCMVYEMLSGSVLFSGETPDQVITKHLVSGPSFNAVWPPTSAPLGLADIVARSLARNPAERYPTAAALAEAMADLQRKADEHSHRATEADQAQREAALAAEVERLKRDAESAQQPAKADHIRLAAEAEAAKSQADAESELEDLQPGDARITLPAPSPVRSRWLIPGAVVTGLIVLIVGAVLIIGGGLILAAQNRMNTAAQTELAAVAAITQAAAAFVTTQTAAAQALVVAPSGTPAIAAQPAMTATPNEVTSTAAADLATLTPLPAPSAATTAGHAATGSGNSLIAFYSNRDGNDEIYVANSDGTGLKRLTYDPGFDKIPVWSPDGTRIAFSSTRGGGWDIWVMDATGGSLTQVTRDGIEKYAWGWSPDGQSIAYTLWGGGGHELYTILVNGTGQRQILDPKDTQIPCFSWSHDGQRLVFTSALAGGDVFTMNIDGSARVQLTHGALSFYCPNWSPDGRRIAYGWDGEIYVMEADGSNKVNITNNPAIDFDPSWSPDEQYIAFTSDRGGSNDIYVMRADGSQVKPLAASPANDDGAAWQP